MTKRPSPVALLARKLSLETRLWRVFLDDIVAAGHEPVRNYLVLEPKTRADDPPACSGVSILPVMDGRIGLLENYRHALGETFFEIPRGFVDPGEAPQEAAMRELTEETGLVTDPAKLVSLGTMVPEASTFVGRVALFVALDCRQAPPSRTAVHEPGMGELRFFEIDALREMAKSSKLEDPSTLIAFYRYLEL